MKTTTLIWLEETVGSKCKCPYCGEEHKHKFGYMGQDMDVADVFHFDACGEDFKFDDEEWITE